MQSCTPFLPVIPGNSSTTTTLSNVSSCDDCGQMVTLPPAFTMWLGAYPVTQVFVTSNGYINIDKNNEPSTTYRWDVGTAPDPISLSSVSLPSGISVLHTDLIPSQSASASVVTQYDAVAGCFTISYQGVPDGLLSPGTINAQVVLWAEGAVDIRWGTLLFYLSRL